MDGLCSSPLYLLTCVVCASSPPIAGHVRPYLLFCLSSHIRLIAGHVRLYLLFCLSSHIRLIAGHARLTNYTTTAPPTTRPVLVISTLVLVCVPCIMHAVFQPRTRKVRAPIGARGVKELTKKKCLLLYTANTYYLRCNKRSSSRL
ncbi:unnamed protein product, partial [Ectocarpus sp. 6 AP-2014]